MILGFIGYGTVGSTIGERARALGMDVVFNDPRVTGSRPIDDVRRADFVIVCVPTPPADDRTLDTSIVEEAVSVVAGSRAIVISSTLNPGTCAALSERFPAARITHIPEFLRQAHAATDFISSPRVVIGCDHPDLARELRALYGRLTPNAAIVEVTPLVAEIAKLASNSFLATKVVFANEVAQACQAVGAEWDQVAEILALDPRIGGSHLRVTTEGGFSGACLPKDTDAFATWLDARLGRESIPARVVRTNDLVRQRK